MSEPREAWGQLLATEWPREIINPYRMFTFFQVPVWLAEQHEVSQGAKLCYAVLCFYAGKNGRAYPHQSTMAEKLGISDRQVRNYLTELEDVHKLIETEKQDFGGRNQYIFRAHPWMELPAPDGRSHLRAREDRADYFLDSP